MLRRFLGTLDSPVHFILPRRVIASLLASFYLLAYVLTPYWSLAPSAAGAGIILVITLAVGALWVYAAAGDIEIHTSAGSWLWLVVIAALVAAINYRALTSVIPWRGDESTFITRTRDLLARVPGEFLLAQVVLGALIAFATYRRWKWAVIGGAAVEILILLRFFQSSPFEGIGASILARWPYVNYWLFAPAPMLARYVWDPNHEILYRLVPLSAMIGVAWLVQSRLGAAGLITRVLWAVSIATIPLVFYYTSVLYIDVLAAFLMVVACLQAESLLRGDFAHLKRNPGWLALILLGFVKDTAVFFLLSFLLTRSVFSLLMPEKGAPAGWFVRVKSFVVRETPIVFCVLAPYAVYMAFRLYLISIRSYTRTYAPAVANLLYPDLYVLTGRSFVEQFGIYLLILLAGLVILFRNREYLVAAFTLLIVVGTPLFYGLDTSSRDLAGYSRFNLFVLPAIIIGTLAVLRQAQKWGKAVSPVLACIALVGNLALSPVHLDGTKVPYWGDYGVDVSEHYYPYDEALLWMKNQHPSEKILFSQMFYRYYLSFYFAKYDWHPDYELHISTENADEAVSLAEALSQALQGGYGLVLFQVKGNNIPRSPELGGFCLERAFRNEAHTLAIYSQGPNCPGPDP